MATQRHIFSILAGAAIPMSRTQIGEKIGVSYRKFQTQLDRWCKVDPPLMQDTGDHHYALTDAGREALVRLETSGFQEEDQMARGSFHISITEGDLSELSDAAFELVWRSLGRVVRTRSALKETAPEPKEVRSHE